MNQKFKLYGMAEVLHLNARKEGPDDDKQLAVDVKLRAITTRDAILYFDDLLAYSLYTDIGAVRNALIGPIPMKNEIEDYRMECAGSIHYGVRLKKFSLEAMDDNKVAITFQASFKPSGDEVATMAEYLQDEISVSIEPANDELDLVGGGTDKMAELNERLGDLVPDEMYAEAKNVVITNGRASISLVQRELRIGYNRAARLIEQMEADRIVSKPDSAGVRQVLYPKEAA